MHWLPGFILSQHVKRRGESPRASFLTSSPTSIRNMPRPLHAFQLILSSGSCHHRHCKHAVSLKKNSLTTTALWNSNFIKKLCPTQVTNVGKDVEKREPSYTVSGNVDWFSHCEKQYEGLSKNWEKKPGTTIWPSNSTPGYMCVCVYVCVYIYIYIYKTLIQK